MTWNRCNLGAAPSQPDTPRQECKAGEKMTKAQRNPRKSLSKNPLDRIANDAGKARLPSYFKREVDGT